MARIVAVQLLLFPALSVTVYVVFPFNPVFVLLDPDDPAHLFKPLGPFSEHFTLALSPLVEQRYP